MNLTSQFKNAVKSSGEVYDLGSVKTDPSVQNFNEVSKSLFEVRMG